MQPGSQTLEFRRRRPSGRPRAGSASRSATPCSTFTRLRLADDMPMVVERTTLPGSYVPGLEAEDLSGSLYELLTNRYGIELVSGTSKLEPVMPDAKTAEWLNIPGTQPCLALHGISFDRRERVFEYTSAVYRGDRYAFTAELRMTPTMRADAKGL